MNREAVVAALEAEGWHAVAEDVRDGLSADAVLRRLRQIGEADSTAAEIVAQLDEPCPLPRGATMASKRARDKAIAEASRVVRSRTSGFTSRAGAGEEPSVSDILESLDRLTGYRVDGQPAFLAHVDSIRRAVLLLGDRIRDEQRWRYEADMRANHFANERDALSSPAEGREAGSVEAARIEGFQRGLAARDEQIRTNTLPYRSVVLTEEEARVAATLVDLMKNDLPPHISEEQQVRTYLALSRQEAE